MKKILMLMTVAVGFLSCQKENDVPPIKKTGDCKCGIIVSKKLYNGKSRGYTTKNYCSGELLHSTTADQYMYDNVFIIGAEYCFYRPW